MKIIKLDSQKNEQKSYLKRAVESNNRFKGHLTLLYLGGFFYDRQQKKKKFWKF